VVTEVDSGRQVTVYSQDPALKGKFDQLRANYPELDNDFNGGDITVNKRMSHNWSLTGGVSFGKTIGNTLSGDLNNPNSKEFARGLIGNDTPYSYRMSGVFDLPYRVSLSATGQYNKGFPEATTVSVGNNTIALTQGTQTVVVAPRGATRLPNVASLDVSLRFRATEGAKRITPRLDFYNLTNQATVTNRTTQLGPAYGVISGIQRGRLIKLGINYDF
jgi:outer membrane receptor protein involved in Fe transport